PVSTSYFIPIGVSRAWAKMQRPDPDGAASSPSGERDWYVWANGQQFGPLDLGVLAKLMGQGTLRPDTLVWRPGFESWVAAERVSELAPPPQTLDAPALPERSAPVVDRSQASNASNDAAVRPSSEESRENKNRSNYVVRHWRGELSLPVSYWINGLLS